MKEVIKKLLKNALKRKGGEKKRKWCKWYDWCDRYWLKFGVVSRESSLRLNITSSWIHFQSGSNEQIFKVFTFEAILFTFSNINLGEKTRNFFPVESFFCMPYMRCLSTCPYSKEPVLPCAPITLILTFVPISGFLQIYQFIENQKNQESLV